ncbi:MULTISPECIES: hypothetical protein [Enterobacter cloacae complex]|uniref:hypothetical protein n=1 Tax=Enterobacter cloacae complex TaxID=354276 RepID=UPI001FD73318|nr:MULTISPECIES: hypothetical protein [Enterobacter cloacae complex]MDE4082066.1 hypothetical protein [Enterobacter pasteurii]
MFSAVSTSGGRAGGRYAPGLQKDQPLAVVGRQIKIVQGHHHRERQVRNKPHQLQLVLNVQVVCRLIEQQYPGPLRQRTRNLASLTFPAGQMLPAPLA